jgi:metal-responsive CopG/Arc/MetJ family transcriptional regulator
MKQRVTLTLEDDLVAYLDQVATEAKQSRSAVVELIISDYLKRRRQAELARQAAMFFSQPETPEEAEARIDWEALSLEILSRDDPVAPREQAPAMRGALG